MSNWRSPTESFLLFASPIPSSNLGFIDSKAQSLELVIQGRDMTIEQSPGLLNSNLTTGTTGAVLWKVTPAFATWIASENNPLFTELVINQNSVVLELGTGISGLVGLACSPRIKRYIATDQEYVLKALRRNIEANLATLNTSRKGKILEKRSHIDILALDWEQTSITELPKLIPDIQSTPKSVAGLDAVIACDCIYNEALIPPFVDTCVQLCQLREPAKTETTSHNQGGMNYQPSICIVAQQLRSHLVFEEWLRAFAEEFRVWRFPDSMLTEDLRDGSGFVVHLGILKEKTNIH
jgi:predicted nicotinamide N-methyase